jgi:hypothetical protein
LQPVARHFGSDGGARRVGLIGHYVRFR